MKRIEIIGMVLILLVATILVFVPEVSAKSEYVKPLQDKYGTGSCLDCHTGPSGGKSLTAYGSSFKSQPGYKSDAVSAVSAIGPPPGGVPVVTDTVVGSPNDTATNTAVVTPSDTTISETTLPVVTQTVVASQTTVKSDTNKKEEPDEKEEEKEEKEETEESPGFGTFITIGIISIIYIIRRYRL